MKMKNKKNDKTIFFLVLILIILSIINLFIVIFNISSISHDLTGYTSGYVNLTVLSSVSINLTVDSISWGFGSINSNETNATLYTRGNQSGIVLGGNWSSENVNGFALENIGNVNCSLYIQNEKDAHGFFNSSSSTNEEYKLNVTNKESNSCFNLTILGIFNDVNITSPGTQYCENFTFEGTKDEIYIDVLLTVPFDSGYIGDRSDTINILCM